MEPLAPETESQHLGGQPKFAEFPGYLALAGWLRGLRAAVGIPVDDLAARLGISVTRVAEYETGSRHPSPKLISVWARACGYTWEMRFNPIKEGESSG